MKKIILCLMLLPALFTSCYKDEGNYDYKELNEITVDTVGVKTSFVIDQYDSLVIEPKINFSLSALPETALAYRWIMYSDAWGKDDTETIELSTERNLNVQITAPASATPYAVRLYITNKNDGSSYEMKYTVTVQPSVVSGILALHQDADGVDFDYIATAGAVMIDKNKHMRNVVSSILDRKLSGNAAMVSSVRVNYTTLINRVYVATDEEFMQFSGYDFAYECDKNELFYDVPSRLQLSKVKREGQTPYCTILVNDGSVYNINNQASQKWSNTFSDPLRPSSSLGERIIVSPYYYIPDANFPMASAIFYDELGKRFVRLPKTFYETEEIVSFDPQVSTAFDVNNVGKDLIWLGKGYNNHAFAVMTDGSSRELYRADFNKAETIYDEDGSPEYNEELNDLALRIYDLSSLTDINKAKFYDLGLYATQFMYATDRDIYVVSISGSNVRCEKINRDFPEGEEITALMIWNPDMNIMRSLETTRGKYLYVATWNGEEGKVYEFKIARNTGRMDNDIPDEFGNVDAAAPVNVFDGMGKVTDLCIKLQGKDNFDN